MNNENVFVMSASRTGSTLVWQCLKKVLKNDDIKKLHVTGIDPRVRLDSILSSKAPCVITERDPMESLLSYTRVTRFKGDTKAFVHHFENPNHGFILPMPDGSQLNLKHEALLWTDSYHYKKQLICMDEFKRRFKGPQLVLNYEKFAYDYDYIFSELESFLDVKIDEDTKLDIMSSTNRGANKKIQEDFENFDKMDKKSNIHGGHIAHEETQQIKELIKTYGYKEKGWTDRGNYYEDIANFLNDPDPSAWREVDETLTRKAKSP
tara:strand:- start:1124 stop:1915 length:792 start_codon:yes stop_codon:yes gene_type:complete